MVIFVQVTEEKLARISILGVQSNIAASSILAAIDDREVSFIAELKCVTNSRLERKGVGILARRVGFLAPHKDKVWVFGRSDEAVVWGFSHFFFVVIVMVVSSFLMGDGAFLVGDECFLDPGPPPLAMLATAAVRATTAAAAKTGIMM